MAALRVLGPSSAWFLIAPASMSLASSSRALAWSVLGDAGGEGRLPSSGRLRALGKSLGVSMLGSTRQNRKPGSQALQSNPWAWKMKNQ